VATRHGRLMAGCRVAGQKEPQPETSALHRQRINQPTLAHRPTGAVANRQLWPFSPVAETARRLSTVGASASRQSNWACEVEPLDPRDSPRFSCPFHPHPFTLRRPGAAAQAAWGDGVLGQGNLQLRASRAPWRGGWPAAWQPPGPSRSTQAPPGLIHAPQTVGCRRLAGNGGAGSMGVVNTTHDRGCCRDVGGAVGSRAIADGLLLCCQGRGLRGAAHPAPVGMACPRAAAAWCSTSTNRSRTTAGPVRLL